MMIQPKVSLVTCTVDGVSVVMDREYAKEAKRSFPEMKMKSLRKGRSRRECDRPSTVRVMSGAEYMESFNGAVIK